MLITKALSLFPLLVLQVAGQSIVTLTGSNSRSDSATDLPTASYNSYVSTSSILSTSTASNLTMSGIFSSMATGNSSTTTSTTSSATVTLLVGGGGSSTTALNGTNLRNVTASSTSSAQPTNTQPCNGYPEFCNRKFSNITMVAAHNSPFIKANNAASNQLLDVTTQLNDGIRMLQSESHYVNGTMYLCHTSCDILNAGTLESYLASVVSWLKRNPYEVIAILMVNSNYVDPGNYTGPVINSGLINYVYTPPEVPMGLEKWPTLAEMILTNKRVVFMLDYQANQTAIPWLLDEFAQMWETPFSPTNASFPCTAQRPPPGIYGALPRSNKMYMANHNLNVEISIGSFSLLTPAYGMLNVTNSDLEILGGLEATRTNCTEMWDRPPNFLLVDFYNLGNFNGSAFQVAADANNVTYNRNSCCGKASVSAATTVTVGTKVLLASAAFGLLSAFLLI